MIPQFFMAGQPKSGSTALYEMLRAHPDVFMPSKEQDYFCPELWPIRPPPHNYFKARTLEEYLALFSEATESQVAGEASMIYLRSQCAARNIAEFNPRARIIVILREPASLLRSLHLQLLKTGNETVRDLRQALQLEEERRQGRAIPRSSYRPQALLYSENVRYVDQLERFRAVFPADQLLVLIYDDFVRDNEGIVRQVFRFLGVDDTVPITAIRANPTVAVRSPRLRAALIRAQDSRSGPYGAANRAVKALLPITPLRHRLINTTYGALTRAPAPTDPAVMADLRRQYAGEVQRLSTYLGRDLVSLWR